MLKNVLLSVEMLEKSMRNDLFQIPQQNTESAAVFCGKWGHFTAEWKPKFRFKKRIPQALAALMQNKGMEGIIPTKRINGWRSKANALHFNPDDDRWHHAQFPTAPAGAIISPLSTLYPPLARHFFEIWIPLLAFFLPSQLTCLIFFYFTLSATDAGLC